MRSETAGSGRNSRLLRSRKGSKGRTTKKKETCGQLRFEKSEMKHARPLFNRVVSGRMVNQFETVPSCSINFVRDRKMNSSELANGR